MWLSRNDFTLGKFIKVFLIIILVIIIFLYFSFQARLIVAGPRIILKEEPSTKNYTRMVKLAGETSNITHLWLNGKQIFTDENGNFTEELILENSYTIATLQAKDRYGREVKLTKSFVYKPTTLIHE